MKKISFTLLIICAIVGSIIAQNSISVPFDSPSWDMEGTEYLLTTHQGKEAILLNKGSIFLKDVEVLNGTVEVDVNFSNRRNFPGLKFRVQDKGNFEEFYVRPHQSGNPDANQYTPVFNSTAGWQLYYGEKWAAPVSYSFDEWHHLKIDINGLEADIYLDDMEKPILHVDLLRDPASGTFGIGTGIAPVYFANFSYSTNSTEITSSQVKLNNIPEAITQWSVSNVLVDSLLVDMYELSNDFKKDLSWNTYESEASGVINLARYSQRSRGNTTVAVKVELNSEKNQLKRLDFGFSDKVRVFVNNSAIYEGNDRYMSRDYRYLGTIGYFDAVFLPLKKGNNELFILVQEAFGGWGLQAKFENLEGISLVR